MIFGCRIKFIIVCSGVVAFLTHVSAKESSSDWINLGSSGVSFRYVSPEEAAERERIQEKERCRNGEIVEPYLRDFETRTQERCEQLLELISECKIREALEKECEVLAGNPCRNPPEGVNGHGFHEDVYSRCDRVRILILRYFHLALSRAREIDPGRAANILLQEKSFFDWSDIRYPNDKEKQEAERVRIARYAALERLDGELVCSLESECGRIEDQLGLRLRNLKELKRLNEYDQFVAEIKRVIEDPELQGEVLQAERLPLGYYFHRRCDAAQRAWERKREIEAEKLRKEPDLPETGGRRNGERQQVGDGK